MRVWRLLKVKLLSKQMPVQQIRATGEGITFARLHHFSLSLSLLSCFFTRRPADSLAAQQLILLSRLLSLSLSACLSPQLRLPRSQSLTLSVRDALCMRRCGCAREAQDWGGMGRGVCEIR